MSPSARPGLHGRAEGSAALAGGQYAALPVLSIAERLLEQRFVLRYIPGSHSYVRASTHLFNTEGEIEALARAVAGL